MSTTADYLAADIADLLANIPHTGTQLERLDWINRKRVLLDRIEERS